MKGPAHRPGAESTADTAELRKHLGEEGLDNCGRTAEELRKHSSISSLSSCPTAGLPLADPAQAPALVRTRGRAKRREVSPATPSHPGGGFEAPGPYVAARYRLTRSWCVMHGLELVAAVSYRKGAFELVRRLNTAHGAGVTA